MWISKQFQKGYIIYTCFVYAIVLLLVFAMGATDLAATRAFSNHQKHFVAA